MSRNGDFVPSSTGKNLRPLAYPDCIYLSELCRCEILSVSECQGEDCAFRCSDRDGRWAKDRWQRRMNNLSGERQEKIAANYYNGKMPWKNG